MIVNNLTKIHIDLGFRRLLKLRLLFIDFLSVHLQTLWIFYEPNLGLVDDSLRRLIIRTLCSHAIMTRYFCKLTDDHILL